MGIYSTRLGCQLSFSEEKEADIIAIIQKLNATHKTGQFISNLIRIAMEYPEVIDKGSDNYAPGSLMRSMEACGISYDRKQFFQNITKEVSQMKQKIDAIYDLAFKTYILGLMGKHLGIEEKSDNNLMATFVLERQLKDLQSSLGLNIADAVYASNKIPDVHENAEKALEYILESYSGIIQELVNKLEVKPIEAPVATQVTVATPVQQTVQPVQQVQQVVQQTVQQKPVVQQVQQEEPMDEEPIDFGSSEEDMDALANLFGG